MNGCTRSGIRRWFGFWFAFLIIALLLGSRAQAQIADPVKARIAALKNLAWRAIGPAIMGGRLTDIEGVPGDMNTVYVGSASGGLWKTTNAGVSWTPLFDQQPVSSIGDIALARGNPDLVWVGTGEDNPRNTVSYGNGVYKSTDGGRTWEHMGLQETERISRVLIHPTNPDIVYVAAIGKIFGPDPNRGVFMTTDGGKTWQKVLYIDAYHGASDLEMDPRNPNILYAGMWRFQRRPWDFDSGSEQGGVYKSVDGGRTWRKLTHGLPTRMGRIGVKVAPSNPNVVYVIAESKEGTLFRSDDRGETFRKVTDDYRIISRGFYYTEMRVDPRDENRIYIISNRFFVSIDGGRTYERLARSIHGDFHTLWIDPLNPKRMWIGNDGGMGVSYDRGKTWMFVNNIPLGQFYQIHADNRKPFYYICGGLQDNGTWCGPSRTRESEGIHNAHWYGISGGDGFFVLTHPDNPFLYLSESQSGGLVRTNYLTGEQQAASPWPLSVSGGPAKLARYRFDWDAPLVASPHDPRVVYFGANVVFRSQDFGRTWEVISPDLTTNDPTKLGNAGGPIEFENTTAEYHCTIISLAESPVQPGLLWVGTDDGNLQITRDGGKTWINVIDRLRRLPKGSPVSHVEPSRTAAGTAYVAFDRHMLNDFRPYIFRTDDFGRTWKSISGDLPNGAYVHVVREDPRNPRLLYAGTERGIYASWDGGQHWVPLRMANFPTVAVHDLVVHPRDNDLIVGTHGRSIWIFDDATPLQQLTDAVLDKPFHLFPIRPALRYKVLRQRRALGDHDFQAQNPPYGALITFYLRSVPDNVKKARIQVLDAAGKVIREFQAPVKPGLNRANWDLREEGPRPRRPQEPEAVSPFLGFMAPEVLPGTYTVRVSVGNYTGETSVEVVVDPTVKTDATALQQQHDLAVRLRDMISRLNLGLRALDQVRDQIRHIQKVLRSQKTPNKETLDELSQVLEQIQDLEYSITRSDLPRISNPPKLLDHLRNLLGSLGRTFAAPTAAQQEVFQELAKQYATQLERINAFLGETVPALNRKLKALPLAPIVAPAQVPR